MDGLYINDFHRSNSMAAQREARLMSLHPFSREQKLRQIEMLHLMATTSKENSSEGKGERGTGMSHRKLSDPTALLFHVHKILKI